MADEKPPAKATKTRRRKAAVDDVVVPLFGKPDESVGMEDPEGLRQTPPKKVRPRSTSKHRISQKFQEVEEKIRNGEITMQEFVETLSPEELIRGQLKDHEGKFRGRPPKWVPAEFYQACVRQLLKQGEEMWRNAFLNSIKAFSDIAQNEALDPKDRLKAAQYVIERVAGKTPDKVEVAVVQPWEQIIGGIVAEAEDDAIARAARILHGTGGE